MLMLLVIILDSRHSNLASLPLTLIDYFAAA